MKVGIIGSGGREHAICQVIKDSSKIKRIFCIPGNAGTKNIAENIDIDLEDFENLKNFILGNRIDLVIVGPEKPLVEGLVDYLEKFGIRVFGPSKLASQLEGSKIFTKQICKEYDIPTAKFGIFQNKHNAKLFLKKTKYPIVIKANNLASGKGVYICKYKKEAYLAVDEIFNGKFGEAYNLLIEEFLDGEEMSFFTIHDGKNFKIFGTAQDHKRAEEGDKGKNTGGMGAYSPSRLINSELERKIINKIIKPTLNGLKKQGIQYKGFLYTGLMIVQNNPYLIEYNVRMGDPECQTILPILKTDLLKIFEACIKKKLNKINIEWYSKKSLCIVLCSKGYPGKIKKNVKLQNLNKLILKKNEFIFHAGTLKKKDLVLATGGRVLNFVTISNNFNSARKNILNNIKKLNWAGGFYRKDIGHKVIKE
tara:strand:- start:2820 stop:4085 length:1266 start_codon:yes stop_codon:yes gene_type:complete